MERYFCLDCQQFGPLTKHGNCSTCHSTAVISGEAHKPMPFPIGDRAEIKELYRMLAL